MPSYVCRTCGKQHDDLPLRYGAAAPYAWEGIPEKERRKRARLSADLCTIDGEHFFVAGNIEIPIVGSSEIFAWTVWTSLSKANFERTVKLWKKRGRETEEPYFGWLNTELALCYPSTINLKTLVHTRPVGVRPAIELEPTDHALALEQRNGITWERVQEIAETILHP